MAAGRKPIIVCDDDQDTLDLLEVVLKHHGYDVLPAHGYKDVMFCLEHVAIPHISVPMGILPNPWTRTLYIREGKKRRYENRLILAFFSKWVTKI